MEDILKNPGLQHIIKTTLTFLDKSDIASFRLVNQYCKNIVNDPIFFLKKLSQLKDIPKDLIENWMKTIQNLHHVSDKIKQEIANELIKICNDLSNKGRCPQGVLHCWTGTPKEMKQFLDLGFYISFSGIVTFPKAEEIHECAKLVPSDKYLIETDSPFLAPVPHRGKRNEPSFFENVANFMAHLRSTELITIAKESSKNAEDLFKFDLL